MCLDLFAFTRSFVHSFFALCKPTRRQILGTPVGTLVAVEYYVNGQPRLGVVVKVADDGKLEVRFDDDGSVQEFDQSKVRSRSRGALNELGNPSSRPGETNGSRTPVESDISNACQVCNAGCPVGYFFGCLPWWRVRFGCCVAWRHQTIQLNHLNQPMFGLVVCAVSVSGNTAVVCLLTVYYIIKFACPLACCQRACAGRPVNCWRIGAH